MKTTSKKRILRMVIFDVLGFCVLAYLICAQVFRFFPFKPLNVAEGVTVLATPTPIPATPTPEPTPAPTDTPAPTNAPTAVLETPDASGTEGTSAPV
ncbi:MAG: hypothetical protein IJI82_05125, partial [Clostridia bacterium]|nr:hypothetical protein [Clostridia bacterium]